MKMDQEFEDELEDFIKDWHWDKKSHEFARKMGQFMFEFFKYLDNQNLSEATQRKHESNCQLIGKFIADYGSYVARFCYVASIHFPSSLWRV